MKRKLAGSIALFYACISLLLISLLGSIMEHVRVYTVKSMASDSSYLALQNSLAGYQRELWEDYHILFLDLRESGGTETLEEELQENLQTSWSPFGEGVLSGRDWMGTTCSVEEVGVSRYLTEENGRELDEQALAYMKYRAVTGIAEQLLEQLDLMQSLKQGKSFLERKLELEKNISRLEEQKNQMIRQLQEMEEQWEQAKEALEAIEEKQENWEEEQRRQQESTVYETGIEAGRTGEGSQSEEIGEAIEEEPKGPDILAELDTLYRIAGNLSGQSGDVGRDCVRYRGRQQEAAGQKEAYAAWLAENKKNLEEHAWEALYGELKELEECQRGDKEYVDALEGKLEQNKAAMEQLEELCRRGMEETDQVSVGALTSQLRSYQSQLLPERYELPSGGNSSGSPFAALKEFASKGVLALVLPAGSEVSDQVLEPSDWQQEKGTEAETAAESSGEWIRGAAEKALLLEYDREHFGCYSLPKKETVLQYEQEYLLIGSRKDRENLAGVVAELLAVRTMADFLQILTKPDKVAQARQMAAAVAGVTGSSALIPVIKTGILLLWSVQDAVAEVGDLMAGKKVPLYQDISPLALDYQGYLLLLRLAAPSERLRAVRLIEGNVQKRYQEAFRAADCAAALHMTVTARVKPHFFHSRLWKLTEYYELGYCKGS